MALNGRVSDVGFSKSLVNSSKNVPDQFTPTKLDFILANVVVDERPILFKC